MPGLFNRKHNLLHNRDAATKNHRHPVAQVDFLATFIRGSLLPRQMARDDYDWHGVCQERDSSHPVL